MPPLDLEPVATRKVWGKDLVPALAEELALVLLSALVLVFALEPLGRDTRNV